MPTAAIIVQKALLAACKDAKQGNLYVYNHASMIHTFQLQIMSPDNVTVLTSSPI